MLPRVAHISPPALPSERRGTQRRIVTFGFDTLDTQNNIRILLLNLSRTGLLLQTTAKLEPGEIIELEIPEAGLVNAKIMRRTGDQYGAMFDTPISQAAVSAVLLAAPASATPPTPEDIGASRRAYSDYTPVPEWLLWSVLVITSLVAVLFVYGLSFLSIAA